MVVLLLTQAQDPHTEKIAKEIKKLKGEVIEFKRYDKGNFITYKFINGTLDAWVKTDSKVYSLSKDIQSILFRIKPTIPAEVLGADSNVEDKFKMYEWRHTLFPIEDFIAKDRCINPAAARARMNYKVTQLKLALACKLSIPNTVISNSNQAIIENLDSADLIYKTLSSFMTLEETIYTNKISKEHILKNKMPIFVAPGIFQNFIPKKHELRITLVENEIFIAKIDSQNYLSTTLDWRYDQNGSMFSPGKLNEPTTLKLFDFHKKSGLIFAVYDFIVDTEGNEIFLECNPAGQWLFLGKRLSNKINKALAKQLLRKS